MTTGQTPLFTVFVIAYRRLGLLQEALDAIRRQTYRNLEIIVVSNGATQEVVDYLNEIKIMDKRIKIIFFSENQSPSDDPGKIFRVCWNTALKESTGEYIWYQSDDDLISDNYVERMVALFLENPECTTAAGLPERIDLKGEILNPGIRRSNYRPRYMPGYFLALSTICTQEPFMPLSLMFAASGVVFAIKKEVLIKAGGYHPFIEPSQMFGIVPFGVTGFDETAVLYFRKHEGQESIHLNSSGYTSVEDAVSFVKDWKIEERWEVFGKDIAKYLVQKILNDAYHVPTLWFVINLYHFRFKSCWRLYKTMWFRLYFWKMLPIRLWDEKRQFWYFIKPKIRGMFEAHQWMVQMPLLAQLHKRVLR